MILYMNYQKNNTTSNESNQSNGSVEKLTVQERENFHGLTIEDKSNQNYRAQRYDDDCNPDYSYQSYDNEPEPDYRSQRCRNEFKQNYRHQQYYSESNFRSGRCQRPTVRFFRMGISSRSNMPVWKKYLYFFGGVAIFSCLLFFALPIIITAVGIGIVVFMLFKLLLK